MGNQTAFSFATTLEYKPNSEKDLAGIVCLQNERFNYVFGVTKKGKDTYALLERTENGQSEIVSSAKIDIKGPIRLQVKASGDNYQFSYALNGTNFENLGSPVSGDILSTNAAGGFTGALVGLGMLTLKLTPFDHFLVVGAIVLLMVTFNFKFLVRAKEKIKDALLNLNKVNSSRPNAFLTRVFFDAKSDEIVSIFSGGSSIPITDLTDVLNKVSPLNTAKWSQIKF